MNNKFLLIIATILFAGCSKKKDAINISLNPSSEKNIILDSIQLDTVMIKSMPTSFVIESGLHEGFIYLLDKYLCTMSFYDTSGRLISKKLGQGKARNETTIGRIATHCFLNNDDLFLLDQNGGYHFYDNNYLYKESFKIIYNRNWDDNKIYESPSAYTQRYNDIVCRTYKNNIYFNVHLAHPEYNFITTMKEHLKRSSNIQEIDIKNKDFGRLLAIGYPKSYTNNPYTKAILSAVNFDISNKGFFYLTYEADSLIYVYDYDFNMIKCYGYAGNNMDTNYTKTTTIKEVGKYYRSERLSKGYYNWIEFVDETNLLFRSYTKGGEMNEDGMQIYENGILKADVNVPKNFRVMGYIKPYYYSYVIADENKEILFLYRFKL